MNELLPLLIAPLFFVACASEVDDEESASSESALKCPSPVDDRDGFMACVKKQTSKAGKSGRATSSDQSGSGRCSSLSIRCTDRGCTCRGNGGDERTCSGTDCEAVCCP